MRVGATGAGWKLFARRKDGMIHALDGGLWLHPFVLRGERMAHLVSSDRDALLEAGRRLGLDPAWLQHKPLKHPRHGARVEAWHWDLRGRYLALAVGLAEPPEVSSGSSRTVRATPGRE